jgi:hypothetical protein
VGTASAGKGEESIQGRETRILKSPHALIFPYAQMRRILSPTHGNYSVTRGTPQPNFSQASLSPLLD